MLFLDCSEWCEKHGKNNRLGRKSGLGRRRGLAGRPHVPRPLRDPHEPCPAALPRAGSLRPPGPVCVQRPIIRNKTPRARRTGSQKPAAPGALCLNYAKRAYRAAFFAYAGRKGGGVMAGRKRGKGGAPRAVLPGAGPAHPRPHAGVLPQRWRPCALVGCWCVCLFCRWWTPAAMPNARRTSSCAIPSSPRRAGEIYAADGTLLAASETCWTIRAAPRELEDALVAPAAAALSEILELDEAEVLEKLSQRSSNDCLLRRRVDRATADAVRSWCRGKRGRGHPDPPGHPPRLSRRRFHGLSARLYRCGQRRALGAGT